MNKLFIQKRLQIYILLFWLILYISLILNWGFLAIFYFPLFLIITTVTCIKKEGIQSTALILLVIVIGIGLIALFLGYLPFFPLFFSYFPLYYVADRHLKKELKPWLFGILIAMVVFFVSFIVLDRAIITCHERLTYSDGKGMSQEEIERCKEREWVKLF